MKRAPTLPLVLSSSLLLLLTPGPSHGACTAPPADLVSWWQAEGNADDAVGTNHGTPVNGLTYAAGYVGQSFSFDGADDYVVIPNGIVPGTARFFTLDAWVYPESVDGIRMIVYGGSTGGEYELLIQDGDYGFGVKLADGNWYWVTSAAALREWAHIAGIRRGTGIELWVNGVMKDSAAVPDEDLNNTDNGWNNSRIGAYNEYTTVHKDFWHGRIDEVDIFGRALAGEEITAIFHAGGSGKCMEASSFPWFMFNSITTGSTKTE